MKKKKTVIGRTLIAFGAMLAFLPLMADDAASNETYVVGNLPGNIQVVSKAGVQKIAESEANTIRNDLFETNLTYTLTTDAEPIAARTYYFIDDGVYTPTNGLTAFESGVDYYVYSHVIPLNYDTWHFVTITNNADITVRLPAAKSPSTSTFNKSQIFALVINFIGDDPSTVTLGWDLNGATVYQLTANVNEKPNVIKGANFVHFIEIKHHTFMIQASKCYPYDFVRDWDAIPNN